jgi:flagellar export protein FliJ
MAFRYSLQSLLRLRQSLERQEEQRLFAIAAVVARLRAEIDQFRQDNLESTRAALGEMGGALSGASLQYAAFCGAAFDKARKKLEQQLEEAERKRLAQLRIYQASRQKSEILQGLRERQEAVYELELARHEQQAADEAFLIRNHLLPNE